MEHLSRPQSNHLFSATKESKYGGGRQFLNSDEIKDPQWQRWEKWTVNQRTSDDRQSELHFMKNPRTGEVTDFKFKIHHTNK